MMFRENTRLKQNSKLGKSMMSIDFIGPMYLKGTDNRINFLACKYIRPEKRGIVTRIIVNNITVCPDVPPSFQTQPPPKAFSEASQTRC